MKRALPVLLLLLAAVLPAAAFVKNALGSKSLKNNMKAVRNALKTAERMTGKTLFAKPASSGLPPGMPLVLDDSNIDGALKMPGLTFVEFYAPWCGHCKALAPVWAELAGVAAGKDSVRIAAVDATAAKSSAQMFEVTRFPTLKLFREGHLVADYNGARTLDAMVAFLNEHGAGLTVGEAADGSEGGSSARGTAGRVLPLNDATFDAATALGVSFVEFYAPWCGHCKNLAPTWEALAKRVGSTAKVMKVDATAATQLAQRFRISSFPTLKLFKDGQLVEDYRGPRDEDSLARFVHRHTPLSAGDSGGDSGSGSGSDGSGGVKAIANGSAAKLNAAQFRLANASGDLLFVKFYAPWCGHCKNMAAAWDQLAGATASLPGIRVVKVDATQETALASTYGVRGFPTLKLLQSGVEVASHTGARTVEAMMNFLASHGVAIPAGGAAAAAADASHPSVANAAKMKEATQAMEDMLRHSQLLLFTKKHDSSSKQLRTLLNEAGLTDYKEVAADWRPDRNYFIAAIAKRSAVRSLPVLFMHGQPVGSLDVVRQLHSDGMLVKLADMASAELSLEAEKQLAVSGGSRADAAARKHQEFVRQLKHVVAETKRKLAPKPPKESAFMDKHKAKKRHGKKKRKRAARAKAGHGDEL